MSSSARKEKERRHGDKVFRDGKMFAGYEVYDDGRIRMLPWRTKVDKLDAVNDAIWDMERSFERLVFERRRQFQDDLAEFRRNFTSELKLLDPSFDLDKFTYHIDRDGFVIKTPRKQPKADDLPKPDDK